MMRAGWHPNGLLKFFTRLEKNERNSSTGVILSDHPASADRAAAMRAELASVKIDRPLVEQSLRFRALKTALSVMPAAPKPVKQK